MSRCQLCLQGTGVDVLAVQPGLVDTPLFDRASAGALCLLRLLRQALVVQACLRPAPHASDQHARVCGLPACLPADKPGSWLFTAAARVMGQSPRRGAYSLVYAAGAPELDGGWVGG